MDPVIIVVIVAVAVAVIYITILVHKYRAEEAREREQEQKREREWRRRRESERQLRYQIDSILRDDQVAVGYFEHMPGCLEAAAAGHGRAETAYEDGAFSPFWSAIEQSYAALGEYLGCADGISSLARTHAKQVAELPRNFRLNPGQLQFPVELDVNAVREQHEAILRKLDPLVYEAQKKETFAIIWEQRRTTAAVVAGFKNLEAAIGQMASRLSSALDGLGHTLAVQQQETASALSSMSSTAAATLQVNQEQLRKMGELSAQAERVRTLIYHPKWRSGF